MANAKQVVEQAAGIITALDALGVSTENATRLLNYHFEDFTFSCERSEFFRASVTMTADNSNHFSRYDVWKQS